MILEIIDFLKNNYLSIAAIVISLISLWFSIYFGFRDRGKIRTNCEILIGENTPDVLVVSAVNMGRRPIVITFFGIEYEDGESIANDLGKDGKGIRLGEKEKYEERIKIQYNYLFNDSDSMIYDFWFEDSMNKQYQVKNAKRNIRRFFGLVEGD